MQRKTIAKVSLVGSAIGIGGLAYFWRREMRREIGRLTSILGWQPGAAVADVGAGSGNLTVEAARRIGGAGQVFASEIDPKKLKKIRRKASKHGLDNITIVEATDRNSGLPPSCCDAILLRGSYHHFTDPAALTADLYQATRPGGVVAVVDFPPRRWLTLLAPVKGVPANRGGHGIPMDVLIQEMTSAGFEVRDRISRWFLDMYCVVFRKPAAS